MWRTTSRATQPSQGAGRSHPSGGTSSVRSVKRPATFRQRAAMSSFAWVSITVQTPTGAGTHRTGAGARHVGQDQGVSENLKLLGEYSKAMAAGDEQAVFAFFAPDFMSHVTSRVNPDAVGTDIRGHELQWWTEVRSAFPDMAFTVDLLIESDDLVVSNWTVRGTHTGTPFYGVAASGDPVEINGTAILRIRDGKIVEHWGGPHCQDGVGLTH
jgi:predicted ester cyclase